MLPLVDIVAFQLLVIVKLLLYVMTAVQLLIAAVPVLVTVTCSTKPLFHWLCRVTANVYDCAPELEPLLDEELEDELLELDELPELEELLDDEEDELELLEELELLLLEEDEDELPEELELLPVNGNMIGCRSASLSVRTVSQSSFKMPPVSPEFGFKHQYVQPIFGLALR